VSRKRCVSRCTGGLVLIQRAKIVAEVEKLQQEGRTVTKFSITGYSLGGLVARYVVG
jgi:dienelactone hydrolase